MDSRPTPPRSSYQTTTVPRKEESLPPSHENDDDINENKHHSIETNGAIGGLVRSLSRSTPSLIRTIRSSAKTLRNLKTIPLRRVANTADKLNILNDMRVHYEQEAKVISDDQKQSRLKGRIAVVARASSGFLKSSLLGTILFGAYDAGESYLSDMDKSIVLISTSSALLGSACGALHGCMHILWDTIAIRAANVFNTPSSPLYNTLLPYNGNGVLLAHTAVNASLFCTYQSVKHILLPQNIHEAKQISDIRDLNLARLQVATVITCAGLTAHLVSESVSHYTEVFVEHGISMKSIKYMKTMPKPRVIEMLPMAVPTIIGFLAYEYSKENGIIPSL